MQNTVTIDQIKRLVLIAIASDDFLMETLVLKGGNAIDIMQDERTKKLSRSSYDLDFSMAEDFDEELEEVVKRVEDTITKTLRDNDLILLDFKFAIKPKNISDELKDFWGGYYFSFKVVTVEAFAKFEGKLDKLIRGAIPFGKSSSTKIEIEISKYEYVQGKIAKAIDGHKIYMYSPQMIVFEKLRALCQQLPQYKELIPSHSPRPRARDFYDIHLICQQHDIKIDDSASRELLKMIFAVKKVPLQFIAILQEEAETHRQDFQNVIDTLSAEERKEVELNGYDFYLNFVLERFSEFTSL